MSDSMWSVAVKAAAVDFPEDITDRLGDLAVALEDRAGVASGGAGVCEARFDVTTTADLFEAGHVARDAVFVFHKACAEAGIPEWPVIRLEVMTVGEQEKELAAPNYPTLLGVSELSEVLGVSRQRASELAESARFPAPFTRLASGPIWDLHAVKAFMETWERRPGRPPAD